MNDVDPHDLPYNTISVESARFIYAFQMSGQIARLFLFLFGEFEKETVKAITQTILDEGMVVERIVTQQATPLRAIYDELLSKGLIEDQALSAEAMLYIDMPDHLQARIVASTEPRAPVEFVPDDYPEDDTP